LSRDPWEDEIPQRYKLGSPAAGKITKITDFGVFVELDGGVEGLIHISETGLDASVKLEERFKPGEDISAKIIKVDRDERKIALSLREQRMDFERREMDEYHANQGGLDQSLGRAAKKTKKREEQEEE